MARKNLIKNSEFNRRFDLAKTMRGFVHDSEVADTAGFSRPTITDWRKGRGMPSRRTAGLLGGVFKVDPNWFRIESIPEPIWAEIPRRSVMDRMPQSFRDDMEAQWAAQTIEQLKTLLQHKVDRNDWGAVQLISRKLQDRELTEFNQKLLKGENPV